LCCLLVVTWGLAWLSLKIEYPVVVGMDPLRACRFRKIAARVDGFPKLTYVCGICFSSWCKESIRHFYRGISVVRCQNGAVLHLVSNGSFEQVLHFGDGVDDPFKVFASQTGQRQTLACISRATTCWTLEG